MEYINQEMKKSLMPGIKSVLKKYGFKGSVSISSNMQLNINIKSGDIDIIGEAKEKRGLLYRENAEYEGYMELRESHVFKCEKLNSFLKEIFLAARCKGWENNSDSQRDYFDISYYISINAGCFDRPYELTKN